MYNKASLREVFPALALDTIATFLMDSPQAVCIIGPPYPRWCSTPFVSSPFCSHAQVDEHSQDVIHHLLLGQPPLIRKTHVATISEDDMVHHTDPQQPSGLGKSARQLPILTTRCGISTGVIMKKNHSSRRFTDGQGEDLTRMDDAEVRLPSDTVTSLITTFLASSRTTLNSSCFIPRSKG